MHVIQRFIIVFKTLASLFTVTVQKPKDENVTLRFDGGNVTTD